MKNICKSNKVKLTVGIMVFLLVEILLTRVGFNDTFPWVNILVLLGVLALIVRYVGVEYKDAVAIRNILMLGFAARVMLMFIAIYGDGIISLPYINDDTYMYYEALDRYMYGKGLGITWYKTFIYETMCIFGSAREIINLLNIIVYGLSFILLLKMFDRYEIRHELKVAGLFVLSFFPAYMLISSSHLREGFMSFFGLVALYAFDRVIMDKKYRYIALMIGAVGISSVFHSGVIVMLAPFMLWIFFFDKEKNGFIITKHKICFFMILVAVGLVFFMSPEGSQLLSYLPTDIDNALYLIMCQTVNAANTGNANYLIDIKVEGIADLILWWPIKMFYVQFSPLWDNWNYINGIFGFLTDSIFYIVASIIFIKMSLLKKYRWQGFFFTAQMLCFQVVYAWGVTNAGAAIRHRSKLFGLILFGAIYGVEMLLREHKKDIKC